MIKDFFSKFDQKVLKCKARFCFSYPRNENEIKTYTVLQMTKNFYD